MCIKDEWNGLADLLAGLIEKYAVDLDIENIPDSKGNMVTDNKKFVKTETVSPHRFDKPKAA